MLGKNRMNGPSQIPDSFAVNESDAQDTPGTTFGKIIPDDPFDVGRPERVQIQNAIDGKLDRLRSILADILGVTHAPGS